MAVVLCEHVSKTQSFNFSASIQKSLIHIEKGNTRCLVDIVDEI